MRAWVGFIALAALAACAVSGKDDDRGTPPEDAGSQTSIPDGGASDAAKGNDAPSEESRCSPAGWCATTLPDSDLVLRDVWPFPNRAFAVADSPTMGAKVLEWNDADAAWKYIDDGTQNESGLGRYVGNMWAPSENEIYYGVSPGYVYHGTRSSSGSAWSWIRSALGDRTNVSPDDGFPTRANFATPVPLGVWGTSRDDVYAWFKDTIYHRTIIDGGGLEWVAEYAATDLDNAQQMLAFFEAAGTSPDDVWFAGGRVQGPGACAILVRRTSGTYRRIIDGSILLRPPRCKQRDGTTTVMMGMTRGVLNNLVAVAPNQLIGFKAPNEAVRISVDGDNYALAFATIPASLFSALSSAGDDIWVSGKGIVARAPSVWDGGKFEISTISLSGSSLNRIIYKVRGTSNTNMWAVGDRYALHKTTP
jgi:hypothetical protein